MHKKDRRIDDKEVQKYEELLNKKTHRTKKDNSSKKKYEQSYNVNLLIMNELKNNFSISINEKKY